MIGLIAYALAADPTAAGMADGAVAAEVTVNFGAPAFRGKYDAEAYAAAFPAAWRDAGIGVCWLPVYRTLGDAPADFVVRFVVGTDGAVSELAVEGATDPDLLVCLQLRSRDWALPAAKKPVRVTQPVRLSRWGR